MIFKTFKIKILSLFKAAYLFTFIIKNKQTQMADNNNFENLVTNNESNWKTRFGLTGNPSTYINQFSHLAGLGNFQDNDTFHR